MLGGISAATVKDCTSYATHFVVRQRRYLSMLVCCRERVEMTVKTRSNRTRIFSTSQKNFSNIPMGNEFALISSFLV